MVHEENEQPLLCGPHTESSNAGTNGSQSILLSTDSDVVHQLELPTANSATSVNSCDELADKTSGSSNSTSSLSKQDESVTATRM